MTTHTHLVIGGTSKTGRCTWVPTLRGATTAHVAYAPDLAFPGAPDTVADLARIAAETGLAASRQQHNPLYADPTTGGVNRALGRAPRGFVAFVEGLAHRDGAA